MQTPSWHANGLNPMISSSHSIRFIRHGCDPKSLIIKLSFFFERERETMSVSIMQVHNAETVEQFVFPSNYFLLRPPSLNPYNSSKVQHGRKHFSTPV